MRKYLLGGALALGLMATGVYSWAQGYVTGGQILTSLNATDYVELYQSTGPAHQFATLTTLANALRGYGTSLLGVALGGTGRATLTSNGVLYGAGTSPIGQTAAMTNGQLLVGATGAAPAPQTMSQDCTLSAAGVITCTKTNNVALTSAATTAIGTSGATIPLLSTANTWTLAQTPTGGIAAAGGFSASPRNIHSCARAPTTTTFGTDTTPATTETYIAEVFVPANMTVTGVSVLNGSAVAGNIGVALATSAGAVVASTAAAGVAASGTAAYQLVPFSAPYAAVGPATYYVLLQSNNTGYRFRSQLAPGNCGANKKTGETFGTWTTVTAPTTFTADLGPIAALY